MGAGRPGVALGLAYYAAWQTRKPHLDLWTSVTQTKYNQFFAPNKFVTKYLKSIYSEKAPKFENFVLTLLNVKTNGDILFKSCGLLRKSLLYLELTFAKSFAISFKKTQFYSKNNRHFF